MIPAVITPFTATGEVDGAALVTHARHLLAQGCGGLVVMGTTGEANSLSLAERRMILELFTEAGLADKVLAGTGFCNLPETVALSRHAARTSVAGVLVMPPFFYRQVSMDGVFAWYAALVEALKDDLPPLYIYDFPAMSGIDIELETLRRLDTAFPGVIAGLKNSSGDFAEMRAQQAALPHWDIFPGTELVLLDALKAGMPGCISASFNVLAAEAVALAADWRADDAARRQSVLGARRRHLQARPMIPALKALLAGKGHGGILNNVRPPLLPLAAGQLDALRQELEAPS
jgi:4-hydroxy-tetrahydrodipicolinate synthase